ncbi:MAG: serine hydrolase [Candidatus Kariarchaeaceae archaeon]|jgi:CubicO group peptidase (beta-lactamase class C family)
MSDLTFTVEMQVKFELLISEEMARTKTPGMSIAIVQNNEIIYNGNFGASNLENGLATNGETLYQIASVTKSFICLGILILMDQGKVKIDDPISKYLPIKLGLEDDPITIHHLMSHTSGIPDVIHSMHEFRYYEQNEMEVDFPHIPMITWEDFFRSINGAQDYIHNKPGVHLHYQNSGYAMLGRIIEIVSEVPLNDYITENILKPIEMKRSTFQLEKYDKLDNVASAYKLSNKKKRIVKTKYRHSELFGYAAGGLMSSVNEMSNYLMFHLNGGEFNGNRIIHSTHLEKMYQFHFEETRMNRLYGGLVGTFGKTGYGYGFGLFDDFYGYKLIHHSGSSLGASAWIAFIPELNIGIVSLANKHPSPRMYALAALAMILGKDIEKEFPLFTYRAHLKKLSGFYEGYKGSSKFKIYAKEGNLSMELSTWGMDVPLIPFDANPEILITSDYYYLSEAGAKQPVKFTFRGDEVWLDHERLKAKKVRDL